MSHFFDCFLTPQRTESLLFGYVKRVKRIPCDVVMIILIFYNEIVYWDFTRKETLTTARDLGFNLGAEYDGKLSGTVNFSKGLRFRLSTNIENIYLRCRIFCDHPEKSDVTVLLKINHKYWDSDNNMDINLGNIQNGCICVMNEVLYIKFKNGRYYTKYEYKWSKNKKIGKNKMMQFKNSNFGKYFISHCFGVKLTKNDYKYYLSSAPTQKERGYDNLEFMLIPSNPVYIIDNEWETMLLSQLYPSIGIALSSSYCIVSGYIPFITNKNHHSQILKGWKQRQNKKAPKLYKSYKNYHKKYKYHRW